MPVRNAIANLVPEVSEWRHELHQNPQTAYEEYYISDFVAQRLSDWEIPHDRTIAETGIVAWIDGETQSPGRSIGLRADMDALDIHEVSGQPWTSRNPGKMHACGHDGHTAMLLGAAKYLNETRNFDGRVYMIFQPAEEGQGGAIQMLREGLFENYSMEEVYALHTLPELPAGQFATCPGPILAASDRIYITLAGRGGHAAMPEQTIDPVAAAGHIIVAVQNYVAREINPLDSVVVSLTNIHGGTGAVNAIPDTVELSGTVRLLKPELRDVVVPRLKELIENTASAHQVSAYVHYKRGYEPTVNAEKPTIRAAQAARDIVGQENVYERIAPTMGGEDFGAMLAECPGNYTYIGQGHPDEPDAPYNQPVHSARFDFNDDALGYGIEYWVRLTETLLSQTHNESSGNDDT